MRSLLIRILKPLSFLPALCMMCLIFSFSAQDGTASASLSYEVSEVIVEAADQVLDKDWSETSKEAYATAIHPYVRKLAHVTEYFLLAVTVSLPLYLYGVRGIGLLLLSAGICVAFASLDEYHQSFVAGRGPSVRDVAIDSIGIFVGAILIQVTCLICGKIKFRPADARRMEQEPVE